MYENTSPYRASPCRFYCITKPKEKPKGLATNGKSQDHKPHTIIDYMWTRMPGPMVVVRVMETISFPFNPSGFSRCTVSTKAVTFSES